MLETAIIVCAKYLVAVPVVTAVFYFFWAPAQERWRLGLLALAALPLAYLLARVAGLFYSHPQPFVEWGGEPLVPHEIDNAFPSDHTLLAGALAALVGVSSRSYLAGGGLFAIAGLIGLARVAAGLHNWLDIAAALVLAVAAVLAAQLLLERFMPSGPVSRP